METGEGEGGGTVSDGGGATSGGRETAAVGPRSGKEKGDGEQLRWGRRCDGGRTEKLVAVWKLGGGAAAVVEGGAAIAAAEGEETATGGVDGGGAMMTKMKSAGAAPT
ncbi:dynein assembly factor 3, axonemal homolog [Ipomoea triloba]|uniref:dynein assembly factor 3, axonemal homolog n=1 Tax=Ipomoea triloba TaxID=35885 RepID=UPI00125DE500|nr:dynein assembly factor 3, axonemal homolog [Ipomoea triloba]